MSSTAPNETDLDKGKSNSESIRTSGNENSLVFTKRKDVLISRRGRGYSKREITTAFANIGIGNQNISMISAFHIPVDSLRRSTHPENVNKLEAILNVRLKNKKANSKTKKRIQTKEKAVGTKKK
jgi:ribosomal protein L13E